MSPSDPGVSLIVDASAQSLLATTGPTVSLIVSEVDPQLIVLDNQPQLTITGEPGTVLTVADRGLSGIDGGLVNYTGAMDLGGQRVVRSNFDGTVSYADSATAHDVTAIVGFTLSATLAGQVVDIRHAGTITEPTWNFAAELPVFLGSNGAVTQVPPVAGMQVIVGVAISQTQLFVRIHHPIVLA